MSSSDPHGFRHQQLDRASVVVAPDGSEVHLLGGTARGSLAAFTLAAGAVARAVVHRSVEEVWFVLAGRGRIWRQQGARQHILDLQPGTALAIEAGVSFQFRSDGDAPLRVVATTMPPWPGAAEAMPADGPWTPTV